MASNSIETSAIAYIEEIYNLSKSNKFSVLIRKINSFVKFINANVQIIYFHTNTYFHKIGLAPALMSYCVYLPTESGKDILRLLHIFVKTNINIADLARKSNTFIRYLSTTLNNEYTWHNMDIFKYHIHLAAYLMLDPTFVSNFDCITIIKLINQVISETHDPKNIMLCLVFYACFVHDKGFGTSCGSREDPIVEKSLSKVITKSFTNIVEDYLKHFKKFYNDSKNENNEFTFFNIRSEFTFDQICHLVYWYSRQSEQTCLWFIENGIHHTISQIFVIRYIPPHFIWKSLDILMIPSQCSRVSPRSDRDNQQFLDSLNYYLNHRILSDKVKQKINEVINYYSTSVGNSINETLDTFTDRTVTYSSEPRVSYTNSVSLSSAKKYNSFCVNNWLIDKNLHPLVPGLAHLTWKGLYLLKILLNEENGRFKVVRLLVSKLDLDFLLVLKFVDCLESLNIF